MPSKFSWKLNKKVLRRERGRWLRPFFDPALALFRNLVSVPRIKGVPLMTHPSTFFFLMWSVSVLIIPFYIVCFGSIPTMSRQRRFLFLWSVSCFTSMPTTFLDYGGVFCSRFRILYYSSFRSPRSLVCLTIMFDSALRTLHVGTICNSLANVSTCLIYFFYLSTF